MGRPGYFINMPPRSRVIVSYSSSDRCWLHRCPVVRAVSPYDPVPFEPLPPGTLIETVVPDANQVVAMDFTPDGRLLYTERDSGYDSSVQSEVGYVRVVVNDQLLPESSVQISDCESRRTGPLGHRRRSELRFKQLGLGLLHQTNQLRYV